MATGIEGKYRAQLLDDLRSLDERARNLRKTLGISGKPGEEVFQYEIGDIDEDLIVVADGYGGAILQHVDGDGDNRLILDSRVFETEKEACDVAERVMEDEIELYEAFPD